MKKIIPLYKIILLALPFSFGLFFVAAGVTGGYVEADKFAIGVLICIISGLPLVKATREYLRSPTLEAEQKDEQAKKKGE
jgi:hypothetical protein